MSANNSLGKARRAKSNSGCANHLKGRRARKTKTIKKLAAKLAILAQSHALNANMSSMDDSANFFNHDDCNETYWKDYLDVRPCYDEPFYQLIYGYHNSHGGKFQTTHDVGTGPGQVAIELADRFERIVASDPNPTHLVYAEKCLKHIVSRQKVELVHSSAHDLTSLHPPGSVDLITMAEAIPLVDAEEALNAFATVFETRWHTRHLVLRTSRICRTRICREVPTNPRLHHVAFV